MSAKPSFNLRFWFMTFLAMLLLLVLAAPLQAAEVRGDQSVTIGKAEVIDDDLIVAGNLIIVDGTINGDLIASGAQITINGRIKGSLLFAGQLLTLNGQVDGAVYSAAGSLTLGPEARVGRNLFFGGYNYRTESGSIIGRDSFIGGYQAMLNGAIVRDLYASLAALELNGKVGGNVEVEVSQPDPSVEPLIISSFGGQSMPPPITPGVRVNPEAVIGGKFSYTSPVEQSATIAATPSGGVFYTAPPTSGEPVVAPTQTSKIVDWLMVQLRHFVSLFLLGALGIWLLPTLLTEIGERMMSKPIVAAGWGFLAAIVGFFGAFFAAFVLFFVVAAFATLALAGLATSAFAVGSSAIGLAISSFMMLVIYGTKIAVFYPLMQSLLEKTLPSWNHYWVVPLSMGMLAFLLLSSIPWFGTLFSIAVTLIGLGAIWMAIRDRFSRPRSAVPQLVLTPA